MRSPSWGPSVLPRLNGQFAFAALDLTAGRLLLARDRFGIKPLYIACADDAIWFASEPDALLAAGIEPSAADGQLEKHPRLVVLSRRRHASERHSQALTGYLAGDRTRLFTGHKPPLGLRHEPCRRGTPKAVASEYPLDPRLRAGGHSSLRRPRCCYSAMFRWGPCSPAEWTRVYITALAVEVKSDLVAFGARYKGDRGFDEGPAAQRVADALGIELDQLEVTKSGWRSGFVAATLHFGDSVGDCKLRHHIANGRACPWPRHQGSPHRRGSGRVVRRVQRHSRGSLSHFLSRSQRATATWSGSSSGTH